VKIDFRPVGPFVENSYLIVDETAGRAVFVDPGDEPDVLIRMAEESGAEVDAIFARVLERVQAVPGVSTAAIAATLPFGASFGMGLDIPGPDSVRDASALYNVVTPDYFRTLGARLLRGRDFSASDAEGAPKVMVINEMLATKYWGATNPVGQCVRIQGDDRSCATIVGVVENIRRQSIFEDSTGFVYFPLAQARDFMSVRRLVVRPDGGDPARLIDPIRRAMQTAAPQLPFADVHIAKDETIARQESDGPSAALGGALGEVGRGILDESVERAAFALPVGGLSEVVESRFGFHVLRRER
jgi:hypothetical protein